MLLPYGWFPRGIVRGWGWFSRVVSTIVDIKYWRLYWQCILISSCYWLHTKIIKKKNFLKQVYIHVLVNDNVTSKFSLFFFSHFLIMLSKLILKITFFGARRSAWQFTGGDGVKKGKPTRGWSAEGVIGKRPKLQNQTQNIKSNMFIISTLYLLITSI